MKTLNRGNGASLTALLTVGKTGTVILQRRLFGGKIEGTMVLSQEEVTWLAENLPAMIQKK